MKKGLRFFTVPFMIVALIGSMLAGCSSTKVDTKEDASAAPTAAATAETTAPEAVKDKPLTMILHRPGKADTTPDANNETNKKILAAIKENTGVDIKVEMYDFGDNANQRLTNFAASKSIESGVWIFSRNPQTTDILNKMGKAGMFWDLADFVEGSKSMKDNEPALFINMNKNPEDGKLYAYPTEKHNAFPHAPGGIAIRKDWLDESGMAYPKNLDEFYKLIKYFKENRKNDAGKPVAPVGFNGFNEFSAWMNHWLGTSEWVKDGDTYRYNKYAAIPQIKEALLFLNKLYNENLLDKESFTQKPELFIQKASNGSVGVSPFNFSGTYPANDALTKQYPNSNKYFVSVPPFAASSIITDQDVNSFELVSQPYSNVVVTKDIPEADYKRIMGVIDYLGTYDANLMALMGFEGSEWEKKDGRIVRTEAYNKLTASDINYQYKAALATYSGVNTNPKAMLDLLNSIATRKADVESVTNIKGHQIALSESIHVAAAGAVETQYLPLIDKEYQKMVISSVSAKSEAEAAKIIDAWPGILTKLKYNEIVAERSKAASELAK